MQSIPEDARCGFNIKTDTDSKLQVFTPGAPGESRSERLERVYRHPGGPLL